MIFFRNKKSEATRRLSIQGFEILKARVHSFLGVLLDERLDGRAHLKHLIEKGRKIVNINSIFSGARILFLNIYRTVLRSAIECGGQFFTWNASSMDFIKSQRLQYKAVKKIMDYLPINIMLSESREFPLYIRFNLYNLKFVYKIMAYKFSLRNSILFEIVVLQNNCMKPSAIHIDSISIQIVHHQFTG